MSDDGIESRIFVGGLDQDCDEAALDKAFSMFGEISQITIMRDRDTQLSRGFGFISFDNPEAAEDAIRRMHGVEVMGRCVTVRKAANRSHPVDRGGFRGRGRGFFRGRGGGDRFDSRGRGSFRGRRFSSDGHSRGGYNSRGSRGSYNGSRRGDYSRPSYRSQDNDRRSGYDHSRSSGYGDSRISPDFDADRSRGSDRYMSTRKEYGNDKYNDSHKSSYRSYEGGQSRDGYSSRGYESAPRPRSRSPIVRYVSREESPVPKPYTRDYSLSPVRRHAVREYSPDPSANRMSKGYAKHESKQVYREYSPPPRSRGPPARDMSPDDYPPSRSKGRAVSPPVSSSRMRQMSPEEYASSRSRGRAGSPRERSAYISSRSSGMPSKSSNPRKEYSSSRSQEFSNRDDRYATSSSRDYSSRSGGGMERGPGISPVVADLLIKHLLDLQQPT